MSHHKIGTSRHQVSFGSLDDQIGPENPVRIIDAFVDMLDLNTFGFQHIQAKQKGALPMAIGTMAIGTMAIGTMAIGTMAIGTIAIGIHPSVLLKIYFYGYFNRIRSSRKLEKECERNIEMRWLCEGQTPSYHTISTFRTYKEEAEGGANHRTALKEVFRAFNRFLAGEDLFGHPL
jgi:transposase